MRKKSERMPAEARRDDPPPLRPVRRRGRGALTNPTGRFEPNQVVDFDDGWEAGAEDAEESPRVPTKVIVDSTRSVITRNDSPDVPFDLSINPYRGCEHGCVYCFARPSHAYLGLSPGLDFETRILAKPRAARLLEAELRRPGYRPQPIAMGTNTDPYQPIEKRQRITRRILKVLARFANPVEIATKSDLVLRDIDLLARMAEQGLAAAVLSITTLDRGLARAMEPRAAAPERRLAAIRALRDAGVPAGVLVAPVIPGLNDREMEAILAAARDAGASWAGYIVVRLPLELRALFEEWLDAHAPRKAKNVLHLLRELHGGALYRSEFGTRMRGTGPIADLLATRFEIASRRLGFGQGPRLDTSRFRAPARDVEELPLFRATADAMPSGSKNPAKRREARAPRA